MSPGWGISKDDKGRDISISKSMLRSKWTSRGELVVVGIMMGVGGFLLLFFIGLLERFLIEPNREAKKEASVLTKNVS